MSSIFLFLVKQYWSFLLLCIIGTAFGVYFGGIWSFLPFIFLLLFFYEWNISPRKERTRFFFDSLPLSFHKRYFIKVLTPFLFSFLIIFLLTYFKKGYEFELLNSLSDAMRISSLFVLSSILAQSMTGFLAWVIFTYFTCFLFSKFSFYEIATLVICLSLSYYYLSEKRASKLKCLIIPIISSILIVGLLGYFKLKIYEFSLLIPNHSIQIISARALLDDNAFLGKNMIVDSAYVGNSPFSTPSIILIPSKYDDNLLEKMETVILKEQECSETCHDLAALVSKFPKNWNQQRLLAYLNSNVIAKQAYALEVLSGSPQPLFVNRVIQLARMGDSEVSAMAISLLRRWGNLDIFQLPINPVF